MIKQGNLKSLIATGLLVGATPAAWAIGSTAGTTISSSVSVDFSVGGVAQIASPSNVATFLIDRKVNVVVAELGGAATVVVPGATTQVTTFTVTNSSNSTLDFRLVAENMAGDDFDITSLVARVESGATPGYQPGEDTADYIDELGADGVATVYLIGDVPAVAANGQLGNVALTAAAALSADVVGAYLATPGVLASDAVETNSGLSDDPAFIDTVFGDIAGVATGDAARDGKHSDDDSYSVISAVITVTKTATVVSDPLNGTTGPKAIPGAVVEYCVDVSNTGAAAADLALFQSVIPTNTTYVPGSITVNATGVGVACDVASGLAQTDAADVDDASFNGTAASIGTASIPASTRFKSTFRVTVD